MKLLFFAMGLTLAFSQGGHAGQIENVELQWVICEPNAQQLLQKLNSPSGKKIAIQSRDVYYSETKDLALIQSNILIRTRVIGKKVRTAVKAKELAADNIPWSFLDQYESKCEQDAYLNHDSINCSLFYSPKKIDQLVSEYQTQFIEQMTNFKDWDQVETWGPVKSTEYQWEDNRLSEPFTVETLYSGQFQSLELSIRVPLEMRRSTQKKVNEILQKSGVNLCSKQEGKSLALLKFLTSY